MVLSDPIVAELREKLIEKFNVPHEDADAVVDHFKTYAEVVPAQNRSGWVKQDLRAKLGEILVLVKQNRDIVGVAVRQADHVDGDPHVDTLLFGSQEGVGASVWQPHDYVAVSQGATEHLHSLATQRAELPCPEVVPEWVVRGVRNSGVEARLFELPSVRGADGGSERRKVVVGVRVAEGLSGRARRIHFRRL
jgi:hypothetical protein